MNETTLTQGEQTLTFKNSMRQYIEFRLMSEKFAPEALVDSEFRANFCYVMGFAVSVFGDGPWHHVTAQSSFEAFEEAYMHWLDCGNDTFYHEAIRAVTAIRAPLANVIEKPDRTVTEDEEADPN